MRLARLNHLAAFVAVAGAVACGGKDGGTAPCTPGPATQLEVSGNNQSWYYSNPLPNLYKVTARDASGCAVPGIVVQWTVTQGTGSVNPTQSTTDASGVASTLHTLGPAGNTTQKVTATPTAAALQPVEFTAFAAAPPTSGAVDVGDQFFRPSSLVVQVGGTVTWTWIGTEPHSVTFNGGADSGTKTAGTFPQTFANPGTFTYHCVVHGNMSGTVTVVH